MFSKFLDSLDDTQRSLAHTVMTDPENSVEHLRFVADDAAFHDLMRQLEDSLHNVIDGKYRGTAAYWAIYVYFVNRIHRELQQTVRTKDVDGFT